MAKPQISASVALLREYWVKREMNLVDLRLRLTIFERGRFEIIRVDESGLFTFNPLEEGIATIDDPACKEPGVYYLRPDNLGQFHQETELEDALLVIADQIQREGIMWHELVITEEENTFRIVVNGNERLFFAQTFAKTPILKAHFQEPIAP